MCFYLVFDYLVIFILSLLVTTAMGVLGGSEDMGVGFKTFDVGDFAF